MGVPGPLAATLPAPPAPSHPAPTLPPSTDTVCTSDTVHVWDAVREGRYRDPEVPDWADHASLDGGGLFARGVSWSTLMQAPEEGSRTSGCTRSASGTTTHAWVPRAWASLGAWAAEARLPCSAAARARALPPFKALTRARPLPEPLPARADPGARLFWKPRRRSLPVRALIRRPVPGSAGGGGVRAALLVLERRSGVAAQEGAGCGGGGGVLVKQHRVWKRG